MHVNKYVRLNIQVDVPLDVIIDEETFIKSFNSSLLNYIDWRLNMNDQSGTLKDIVLDLMDFVDWNDEHVGIEIIEK